MNTMRLTQKEFDDLPDYSCSVPTGTTIGKRWKRRKDYYDQLALNDPTRWFIGEYVPCDTPGYVGIKWSVVEILNETETIIHRRTYG